MLLLHEPDSRGLTCPRKEAVDEVADTNDDYEDALIWLLSRLEHKRQGLEKLRSDGRLEPMLDLATQFADLVSEFADENCAFAAGRDIDEATTRIRDFRATRTTLGERLRDNEHKGCAELDAALQSLAKRCFTAFHEGVFAYFTVFTSRFPTSRAAFPWVEAAASFVVDLKKLTREPNPIRS